jgi:hypothetical protein
MPETRRVTMITLQDFLDIVDDEGIGDDAKLAVEDSRGNIVWIHCVDVEKGDEWAIRFFRDDDIPGFLGAPGPRIGAESAERAAEVNEVERTATMYRSNPYYFPCIMSMRNEWRFHDLEYSYTDEIDGYEVMVFADGGEHENPYMLF